MATTIYVPRDNRMGEIGTGLGQGITAYTAGIERQRKAEVLGRVLDGINQAPDRNTALQVMSASAKGIEDPNTLSLIMKAVDERHPQSSEQLMEIKTYDNTTGAERPVWVKRGDFEKTKDPKYMEDLTGMPAGTYSFAKPVVKEYINPANGDSMGMFVPGMQPKGAITTDDFQRDRQTATDNRAIDAADRADKRLTLEQRRTDAMERRLAATEAANSGAKASAAEEKRVSTEQNRLKNYLATQYGGKTLQDGTLDLSSLDEPKRQKFTQDFERASELLDTGEVKTWGSAVRQVNKERKTKTGPFKDNPDDAAGKSGQDNPKYKEYLDAFNAAKGNPELQKKITERAKKLGVVK